MYTVISGIVFLVTSVSSGRIVEPEIPDYDDKDIRLPNTATGRPLPPELASMLEQQPERDQDFEVCMSEYIACHGLKHGLNEAVCAEAEDGRHRSFIDICSLNYENCKQELVIDHPVVEGGDHTGASKWHFVKDGLCPGY